MIFYRTLVRKFYENDYLAPDLSAHIPFIFRQALPCFGK